MFQITLLGKYANWEDGPNPNLRICDGHAETSFCTTIFRQYTSVGIARGRFFVKAYAFCWNVGKNDAGAFVASVPESEQDRHPGEPEEKQPDKIILEESQQLLHGNRQLTLQISDPAPLILDC